MTHDRDDHDPMWDPPEPRYPQPSPHDGQTEAARKWLMAARDYMDDCQSGHRADSAEMAMATREYVTAMDAYQQARAADVRYAKVVADTQAWINAKLFGQ